MKRQHLLQIARDLLACPTAPLHENAVQDFIQLFCRERAPLRFIQDRWGNLIVTYRHGANQQPVVFEAHMDHPGFEILGDAERGNVAARFLGGVHLEALKTSPIKIFCHAEDDRLAGERKPGGVRGVVVKADKKRWAHDKHVTLKVDGPVRKGDFGMWDLKPLDVRGGKLYTRACDDLIGCISMLALLDELVRRNINGHVVALFTRGEEIGFLGALALSRDRVIPPDAVLIGIETSKEIPAVKMGNGPIIRVGDRTSVFNSDVTFFLSEISLRLKAKNPTFQFQRALMDGGTCNSTVYHQQGYRTGAVCVALGNYHNQDAKNRIREEFISVSDLENMVQMFVEVVREAGQFEEIADGLTERLDKLYREARRQLGPKRKGQ